MAILDAACRLDGVTVADDLMTWLSPAQVAICPPEHVVVNNTFIKVLRPRRNPAKEGSADAGYFQRTISYREYAQLGEGFAIALEIDEQYHHQLRDYLLQINYFGKRGSFMQIQDIPYRSDNLPDDFIAINGDISTGFRMESIMTQLDDTSADVTFKQANIYNKGSKADEKIKLGKDRILHHVSLPYRLVSSSRGYSFYELKR
ncbi:MAG: hypothetical protein Crog4KO_34570 [Crocinitomicaceae bacterium]